jgi:y4mF family transcriptional regulator
MPDYTQKHIMEPISTFVKNRRKKAGLTQTEFAERAGVALTVVRKIEQGRGNLNMKAVNQVLKMFGHTLAPVPSRELTLQKAEDNYATS